MREFVRELKMLYSIVLLSLSGAFKLEFAFEFLGRSITADDFVAAVAITYAAYALDRGIKNKEDEDCSEVFMKLLVVTSIFCVVMAIFVSAKPLLILPFVVSYLYAKGIKNFRLKVGKGVKNLVVAFTWTLGIVAFVGDLSYPAMVVYSFFFLKSFVNTIVYDFKDVDRDIMAGIMTLPAFVDTKKLKVFLMSVNSIMHVLILLVTVNWVVLASFVNGMTYILLSRRNRRPIDLLVVGEWVLYKAYRTFLDSLM